MAASRFTSSQGNIRDITKYTTDKYDTSSDPAPPDNKDNNVYASFPNNSAGPSLGANPTSAQGATSINQGPLWWIKKLSPTFQPWFWYCPAQIPLAFGFFAGGGAGLAPIHWGYRGFQLLNYFPVIWILAENNPLQPMGSFGADGATTPNGSGQYPKALDVSANAGPYQSGFPALPNAPPFQFGGSGTFAPFGMLPMLQGPPVPQAQWQYVVPTIWQMTGVKAPKINPNYPATGSYYLPPTSDQAQEAAQTFADNWNSVATACNDIMYDYCYGAPAGPAGGGGLSLEVGTDSLGDPAPAGWKWDITYTNNYSIFHTGTFANGLNPGIVGDPAGLPLEIFVPATVATLAVGQLDPAKWNTQPCIKNPLVTSAPTLW